MKTKKYKILYDEENFFYGKTLYRIQALKDFGDVKAGDLGGFVENDSNLSHSNDCWIYDNAQVFDDAEISDNAKVYGNGTVSKNAKVFGGASVFGNAWISGNGIVSVNAQVSGDVFIYENARISGKARISGNAKISGDALIYDNAQVYGNALVFGRAKVFDDAKIYGNTQISGMSLIKNKTKVMGYTKISSNFRMEFGEEIYKNNAYLDNSIYPLIELDGMPGFILKDKRKKGIGLMKVLNIHGDTYYAATNGIFNFHGVNGYEAAKKGLKWKIKQEKFKIEKIEEIKAKGKITREDYKELTGACDYGIDLFCKENNISDNIGEISLEKAIDLLKDSDYYGAKEFVKFMNS